MTIGKLKIANTIAAGLLSLMVIHTVYAGEVEILAAEFLRGDDNRWSVNVTLKHADTGWEHYADNWRIVDAEANILGDRVLYHPHVDEQPFTRGLSGVKIPAGITTVYVEAHDKDHGWSPNRVEADLNKAVEGRLKVEVAAGRDSN